MILVTLLSLPQLVCTTLGWSYDPWQPICRALFLQRNWLVSKYRPFHHSFLYSFQRRHVTHFLYFLSIFLLLENKIWFLFYQFFSCCFYFYFLINWVAICFNGHPTFIWRSNNIIQIFLAVTNILPLSLLYYLFFPLPFFFLLKYISI